MKGWRFGGLGYLLVVSLGCGGGSAAFASGCHGSASPVECQYEIQSAAPIPAPEVSSGLRFDSGVVYALFDNYAEYGIPPVFMSNRGRQSLFVPQGTADEYLSFLRAAMEPGGSLQKGGMAWDRAVPPAAYEVVFPADLIAGCRFQNARGYLPFARGSQSGSSNGWLRVNGYALLDRDNAPANLTTTGKGVFTENRTDCSQDDEGNGAEDGSSACNAVLFSNVVELTFAAQDIENPFFSDVAWQTAPINVGTSVLSVTTSGVQAMGAAIPAVAALTGQSVQDCAASYAPVILGRCAEGFEASQNKTVSALPANPLCASGDVAGSLQETGLAENKTGWTWTCHDVQGTSTGETNVPLQSGQKCLALFDPTAAGG